MWTNYFRKGTLYSLFCVFSFVGLSDLNAQTTYTIGTGTTANTATGYPTPYGNWYWGNRTQFIYRASELTAAGATAGLISSISFNITNLNSLPTLNDFEIKIKNDATNDLSTGWVTGMTTVFSSTAFPPPASTGWNTHTFTSPFMWDGVSNIIIEVCSQNSSFTSSGNASVQWTENLPTGTSRTYRMDALGICSNTATSNLSPQNRPNAQFVITSGPCTAPPTAGTTTGQDSVCPAELVNLSLSGATGGTGQTFQWQSSPDGTTWTNLPNDTLPGLSTNITAPTHFRCIVTCNNQSATSTSKLVVLKPVADCYCPSTATSTTFGYIQQVELGSINQLSPVGCGQQYTNYTDSSSTNLIASVTYPISIDVQGCSGGTWTHSTKVWIDFNQNGSFLDPGEEVFVESPHQYGVITGNITIPTTNIVPGPTIMRVVTIETGAAASVTPCGTYTWGETEDYTVVIIADTCTSPVTIGALQASEPQVCPGVPSTITAPNMSMGITQSYQWQVSADSTTWNDISGATNPQYTATSNDDRFYRLKSACQGDTTISDPIKITIAGDPLRGTYTINQLAAPSPTNFTSFTDLVDALNCGGVDSAVVINVVSGTGPYNEQIFFGNINGTSAANTITINGNGTELQFAATDGNERYTLALSGTSYLTIDSLKIVGLSTGNTDFGWGVWLTNNAQHNTIKNSEIIVDTTATNTNYGGIIMSAQANNAIPFGGAVAGSYNVFENNHIFGGYYGVTAMANNAAEQGVGNQFIDNTITDFRFYGMYLRAQDSLVVKGNDITRGDRFISGFVTFYGIYFTTGFTNNIIDGNRIYNSCGNCNNVTSAQYAVFFIGASGTAGNSNLFSNNLIHDINGDGNAYGIYAFTNNHWRYYHNSIIMDATAASTTTWAVYSSGNTADSEFINNIISADKSGTVIGLNFPTATNAIGSDYNGVYVPNGDVGRLGTTNYSTLTDWQTQGFDANSQEAPPLFVDPANFDYAPGTPAFSGQGINLLSDVPNDFFGVARTTTPDLGAIEFVPTGCAGPFGFGVDSITSSSGFFTWDSFENDWVVEWGPVGFLPGSAIGTQVPASSNNMFEVTGFSSNTCYHVFVAEVCNGDTSTWTGPITVCTPKANDAALLGIVQPKDRDCGEDPLDIQVELRNNGFFPITSVPITVEISGDFSQTINFTYSGNLAKDSSEVVTVGSVDFSRGGIFDIVAWVVLPNDEDSLNDTASVNDIRLIPAEPRFDNLPFCAGDDSVTVFGIHLPQLVSYGWYDVATGGTRLSGNDTITVAASQLPNLWLGYDSVPNTPGNRVYCTANATSPSWGYIQSVQFGSINQVSPVGCGQQYTDYTDSASTAVNLGQTIPISIDVQGCSGGNWTHSTKVFIDFNGNGDFTDPGEEVLVESPHQYGVVTGNITIPMSATPGLTTTMRVITVETSLASNVNPCGTFTWGEVEDYTVEILGAVACSPNRTQVDISADSVPVASFSYTELPNLEVEFINTSIPAGTNATWDFGPLGTATGDTVTIAFPDKGDFTVCLEVSNFCASDNTCETVTVNGIGVETFHINNLKLFPNPNQGQFTLSFTQDYISDVLIEIVDMAGKVVYTQMTENFSGEFAHTFEKGALASGAYMLRIRNDKGSTVKSVIVNK